MQNVYRFVKKPELSDGIDGNRSKKFSSKNILIADNALIKITCPTTNLFKPSISMDNSLQVDKQKLFIGRFFYSPNYSGSF